MQELPGVVQPDYSRLIALTSWSRYHGIIRPWSTQFISSLIQPQGTHATTNHLLCFLRWRQALWFHTALFQHLPQRCMKSASINLATCFLLLPKKVVHSVSQANCNCKVSKTYQLSVNFHILRLSLETRPLSSLSTLRAFLVLFCSRHFLLNFWHPNFNFGKLSRRSTKSTASTAVGATFSFRFSGEQVTTRVLQRKASNGTYQPSGWKKVKFCWKSKVIAFPNGNSVINHLGSIGMSM